MSLFQGLFEKPEYTDYETVETPLASRSVERVNKLESL